MKNSIFQRIKFTFSGEQIAVGVVLLLGFILRLKQFLIGRSLWLDEAMLALNIVNRDYAGLFKPLDYDQGAPIGFLLVEKTLNLLIGDHEFVFRIFPLVVGIVALYLFYLLLRRTTTSIGLLTGLALFAVSPELIYYSSEMKQYIVDVGIAIALLLLATPILESKVSKRNYIYLGLAGILALWFSHPALFILAGLGVVLFLQALWQRKKPNMLSIIIVGAIWLSNLGLLYFVTLRGLSRNAFLLDYWQENFMPLPPWTDWMWFALVFKDLLQNQIGISTPAWLAIVILTFGFIFLIRKNRIYASVLLAVFIFSLIASAFRVYPLGGRLSLFLVPLMIILIGQFIDGLQSVSSKLHKLSITLAIVAGIYLLYSPANVSLHNFIKPKYFEHIRPTMATLSKNWMEGDVLFVSYGAVPAFRFYAERYGLGDVKYQTSETSDYQKPANLALRLQALDGNTRVWVLVTHVYETKDFNEKDFILTTLDTLGEHKREFRSPGTSVYLNLYDLSP